MNGMISYQCTSRVWQYASPKGGWYFITLPIEVSTEIRDNLKWQEEGWGRLRAKAQINDTEWDTAIWFDTKINCYLLPLKAEIRRKENLKIDDTVSVVIRI